MSKSKIQWTDTTWNPVTGCTKVSEGCRHCYAEKLAPRVFAGQTVRDRNRVLQVDEPTVAAMRPRRFTDVRCHPERLDAPLRWRKPRRVFVNSMSDLFHGAVPDEFIRRVFSVMALAPQHTFQVLTKRPERMRAWVSSVAPEGGVIACLPDVPSYAESDPDQILPVTQRPWPLPNVWLGVSCENQETADERIPILLDTPAAVRFVSAEPLLGVVDLRNEKAHGGDYDWLTGENYAWADGTAAPLPPRRSLAWCVTGGESGPKARPCDVAWIRSIVDQCKAAGVPCFVKQLGAKPVARTVDDIEDNTYREIEMAETYDGELERLGVLAGDHHVPMIVPLRDRKGGDPAEWPEDLRVREWPS